MDLDAVRNKLSEIDEDKKAQEAAEAEANKGILEKAGDYVRSFDWDSFGNNVRKAMGETYGNEADMNPSTPRPFGKVEDIASDVVGAVTEYPQRYRNFLHEAANTQEKYLQAQETGDYSEFNEQVDVLRQAGRDTQVALTNIAAAPFRQAARNFIQNNIDDNTSPYQQLAQQLEQTDVNQEYFMTPAEKLQKSREIEQELGLPAESTLSNNDAFKEALEMYNFKKKHDNIEYVWEEYPELKNIAKLDKEAAAIALHDIYTVKNSHNVIDSFMTFLERGSKNLEYNNLQYKIMEGRATEEEMQRAQQLEEEMAKDKRKAPSFFESPFASMAAGVGESLPEMAQGIKEASAIDIALTTAAVAFTVATSGAGAGVAAGGVAAARQILIKTLAKESTKKLLKAGTYYGMIHGMGAPESGSSYAEMKKETKQEGTPLYTDEEARFWSLLRGYTNAGIESANLGIGVKALSPVASPIAAKVFAQSTENIVNQTLGRETLMDFAKGRVGDWLKLTVSESAEEAAQSVADDVLVNMARDSKGKDAAHLGQYSVGDMLTRAGNAFIESLPGSMGFATLGAGFGTITGGSRIARSRKRAAAMEKQHGEKNATTMMGAMMVEQLQKTVQDGNMQKVAPDVQKKVLREQLAGTKFEKAYIDVEQALKQRNGREDLKKIAEAQGMSTDELEAAISVNGFIPVGTEVLAQVKTSPEILETVSFSDDADSMAKMRENSKKIVEEYNEKYKKMVENQIARIDTIADEYLPKASDEHKDALKAAIIQNPANPAQGWNDLYKGLREELMEKIGPALDAMRQEMRKAGFLELPDEQGNLRAHYYTENGRWYSNFYNEFKRYPNKQEMEDMAVAMVTGDSSAPQVLGWVADSADVQAAMEREKPVIDRIRNQLKVLEDIKPEAKKMTGVEMELTDGLTPEGFKVYRALSSWTEKAGGKIKRAGRMSAILVARHADIVAAAITKNTGKKYTAEDYLRDRIGLQLVPRGQEIKNNKQSTLYQIAPEPQKVITINGKTYKTMYGGEDVDVDGKIIEDAGIWYAVDALGNIGNIDETIEALEEDSNSDFIGMAERAKAALDFLRGKDIKIDIIEAAQPKAKTKVVSQPVIKKQEVEEIRKTYGPFEGEGYNPRDVVPKVRGGWTENKILRYLKAHGTPNGVREAVNLIAEFDSVEELKEHMFFHGSAGGSSTLKPSITMSDREIERIGGGGYGEKYWGISVTPDKKIASRFSGEYGRSVNIYPLILAKNAIVEENPNLEDAADIESQIVDYWTRGVDAVWVGDKNAGEKELLVLNPRAVVNIGRPDTYQVFKLGTDKNPLNVKNDEEVAKMLNVAKALKGKKAGYTYGSQETRDTIFFQRAWHGTPHDFASFDLGAIGSGEGAQAHGWGLYFAGDRAVAERYQKVLSEKTKGNFAKFVRRLTGIDIGQKGSLYEVEVPNNNVLLDEEKTFDEQHKNVKDVLGTALNEFSLADLPDNAKKYLEKGKKAAKDRKVKDLYNDIIVYTNMINQAEENLEGEVAEKNIKELEKKIEEAEKQIANIEQEQDNQEWYKDLTGKEIYKVISGIKGGDKKASQFLNEIGIKGITYNGFEDGRCFVIFDDKAIEAINKFNQERNFIVQGGIAPDPKVSGRHIISILETADESTFMHEMAHAFLFDLEDLAKIDEVSRKELEIVDQWATWQKGAAAEYKGTEWAAEFAKREQAIIDAEAVGLHAEAERLKYEWKQERFARGFEIYLKEGKAPAKGLKAVFRAFKSFLRVIYKAFVGDGGKPSEPVRRVMDRMIASEEEIEAAALDDRYRDTLKAGGEKLFDEKEEETYKRWIAEEQEAAKEKVMKIVMQDLEKEKQAAYDAEMEKERERYRKALSQESIFLARQALAETKDPESVRIFYGSQEEFEKEDKATPPMTDLIDSHMEQYGVELDNKLIESHLTQEAIDKAMQSGKYRDKIEALVLRGMERKKALINRINVKARAAMDSIEDKLNALPEDVDLQLEKYDNPTVKAIMKEINKLRFSDKWSTSDINHIEAMMRASTQADVKKAIKELKDKQRQEKQDEQDLKDATAGMEAQLKDMVRQVTETKPMTETCNVRYYMDKERNAGRRVNAMRKAKNWEGAIQQQRWKVFYSMMVKEARKNKETRDKMVKDLERKAAARSVRLPKNERYWFNRLLYVLRITKEDPKVPEGGAGKLEDIFKEGIDTLDMLFVPEELLEIRDKGENFGDYNQKSLQEFTAIHEDLVRLYTIGKDKFNLKTIGGRSVEEVAQEIMEDPTANGSISTILRKVTPDTGGLSYIDALDKLGTAGQTLATGLQKYNTSILKPENILKLMGEKAHKYIYGILEKAAEKEAELTAKNIEALRAINAMYSREEHQSWTEPQYTFFTEKGQKITKENVFAMALNYGTETNRQRLIGGLIEDGKIKGDISAQEVQKEVEALFQQVLTEKDWQYVQKLWDYIGSYWHETAAVEEKLNGVAMGRVKNSPFKIKTADGQEIMVKGGYMHIKYAFDKSSRAEEQQIEDAINSMHAGAARLGAGRGMTKARTEQNIYRPLQLDFTVVEEHLQNVIHNISFRVPLRDIYRLLHYSNFKSGVSLEEHMKRTLGVEAYRVIDNWALDAWKIVNDSRNSADGVLNSFIRFVRAGSVMSIMGYAIWPVVENLSNVPVAADKIGNIKLMAALKDFYAAREENMEHIRNLSAFMRTRTDNLDRDLRSQPGTFRAGNRLLELAKEHAYDMMVWSDLMVSGPLWLKSFKDSFEPMIKEVRKENDENMAKRLELAAKVDELRAKINEELEAAADIDKHLHIRRYGKPDEIEALRGTPYSGLSDAELRAQWGQNKNNARDLGKDLYKAEFELEQANNLPVYDDNEMLEEAKKRAVYAADAVVRDTFGSGRNIDLPAVQRSKSELVRLFTAFYSFFNTQYNALYMAYMDSKYMPGESHIMRWAPFAKAVMYRVVLSSLISSALAFGLGVQGNDKDDKEETVLGSDGKKTKVIVPAYERFLKVWAKNALGVAAGGLYAVRDIATLLSDYAFTGKNYGYKFGSVATRGITETWKAFTLISSKGEKDAEIQAREEKKEREHQEKLRKYKGKKRQEYLKKWEEEQKYKKPPKRITYPEILGHAAKGVSAFTAAKTGVTSTMTNAVTGTMEYLLDKDMRYDPTFRNIIWSAVFNKRPIEREIPQKPPAEPKKKKNKNEAKQFGR